MEKWLQVVGALALGQAISLLNTATAFTSSTLARRGIDAPTSQSFCNYLLITCVYGFIHLRRSRKKKIQDLHLEEQQPFAVQWYYYLALAFIDVEANYVVVKAYQYTSLTSVMLLDCWSIPCVLLLTCVLLKTKYTRKQLLGAGICVAGLVLVVLSDVHAGDRAGGSRPLLGDTLVFISAMLYALSNVSEEFLIKKVDFVEVMAFLGSFGALISGCQLLLLERKELQSIHWSPAAAFPFLAFAVSMFCFYTLVPLLLKLSGSAMLNLSLLTADMWAVLIRIFAYHQQVDWFYYAAFLTVAAGLTLYSLSNGQAKSEYKPVDGDHNPEQADEAEQAATAS